MDEIWKDIENYEGLYQVSNLGRVKSLERTRIFVGGKKGTHVRKYKERILRQPFSSTGYYMTVLSKDGVEISYKSHQLVAKAFIPNPNGYKQINHKDENPLNNIVDNLEWCDAKYNCNYGFHNKKLRESMIKSKGVKIHQYDLYGNLIKTYICGKDVEKSGFDRRGVYECCYKKTRKYKNYVFRFDGDDFSLPKSRSTIRVFKYDTKGNLLYIFRTIREAQRIDELGHRLFSIRGKGINILFHNGFKYQIEEVS